MEQKLTAELRTGTGKGPARQARMQGRVPGVLYGHELKPVPLTVDSRELFKVLHTEAGANVLIDLKVDDETHLALAREIHRDHVKGRFVHVDFLAIRRDEKITVEVPVRIVGDSVGVKEGGAVEHHVWDLRLECLPGDVPEAVEADITELGIGDSIRVSELPIPEGIDVLTNAEEVVVAVVIPQLLKVEEEVPEGEAVEGEEGAEGEAAEGEAGAEGAPAGEGGDAGGGGGSGGSGGSQEGGGEG
jgi:large subunit ribosomal protein L25